MQVKSSVLIVGAASVFVAGLCIGTAVRPTPPTPSPAPSAATTVPRVVEVAPTPSGRAEPDPSKPPPPTSIPVPTVAPTAAPPPPGGRSPTRPSAAELRDGTFVVGTEIAPGTYRTAGGPSCYWARLSGFGGSVTDVVTNGLPRATELVTIAPSDKGFTSRGCGVWTKVS